LKTQRTISLTTCWKIHPNTISYSDMFRKTWHHSEGVMNLFVKLRWILWT